METRQRRKADGAGGVYEEEFQLPVWFDAMANGKTPMNAAFSAVVSPVRNWVSRHPDCFPPIVINLTDGAYTDQSPAAVVRELMQMGTSDGNVLVFNCHISADAGMAVAFPDDAQAAGFTGLARELYDMSSPLPDPMRRQAEPKGYRVGLRCPRLRIQRRHGDNDRFSGRRHTRAIQDRAERAQSTVLADAKDRSGRQTL